MIQRDTGFSLYNLTSGFAVSPGTIRVSTCQAASFRVPPARRSSERFEVFGGLRRKVPLKYVRQVNDGGTDWYCFAFCHVEDRTENMKIRRHRKYENTQALFICCSSVAHLLFICCSSVVHFVHLFFVD